MGHSTDTRESSRKSVTKNKWYQITTGAFSCSWENYTSMNNRQSSLTHLFTDVTCVINIYQALPACYQGRGKAAPDPLGPEVGHLSNPLALPYNVDCLGLDLPPSCRPLPLRPPGCMSCVRPAVQMDNEHQAGERNLWKLTGTQLSWTFVSQQMLVCAALMHPGVLG